jgi:hypothetical protein
MTNSETQTEPRKNARKRGGKASAAREPAKTDTADEALTIRLDKRTARVVAVAFFVVLLLGGWLGILHLNRWHFGPPVFFLWAGWLGVLLTARFLWTAGMTAAYDDGSGVEDDEFWKPVGAKDELLREKRSLLKAIKEIEFDHAMGKLSAKDAAELTRYYRARAIELIKAMEGGEEERELSIEERIEREVKARLSVAGVSAKAKAESNRAKAAESTPKVADKPTEPEADKEDIAVAASGDEEPRPSAEVGS